MVAGIQPKGVDILKILTGFPAYNGTFCLLQVRCPHRQTKKN